MLKESEYNRREGEAPIPYLQRIEVREGWRLENQTGPPLPSRASGAQQISFSSFRLQPSTRMRWIPNKDGT